MTLQEQISQQLKDAMRAKDTVRLSVMKNIKAAFTNELVAQKRTPTEDISDEDAMKVITKLAKQRKDSIQQFTDGGRADLAEGEAQELAILEEFLPEMMSEEEIRPLAEAKRAEMGVDDPSKAGILVGALMKDLKGKADGGDVKKVVESLF
jgi:uncharacterized protein YqeY